MGGRSASHNNFLAKRKRKGGSQAAWISELGGRGGGAGKKGSVKEAFGVV